MQETVETFQATVLVPPPQEVQVTPITTVVPKPRRQRRTCQDSIGEEEKRTILGLQKWAFVIFLGAYGFLLLPFTLLIILLQGFHTRGFDLPLSVIFWLGGLTVGKLASFTYIAIRFLFPRRK